MIAGQTILDRIRAGNELTEQEVLALSDFKDTNSLMRVAQQMTIGQFDTAVTYSRKVFIPLTQLCRDVCGYCTFAHPPRMGQRAFLSMDEVLTIARRGAAAGCKEALFTLGDKPELRYEGVRNELAELGFSSTLAYLEAAARQVFEATGLLPHLNPGVMTREQLSALRTVSVSMGLMLESASPRLFGKGMAHWRCPDKLPQVRLDMLRTAGELAIPFTTGLLIGIGETRRERLEALLAIRELQRNFGHIQEVIIQNFRPKPLTRMAGHAEPELEDYLWSIAAARLVLGPQMSIQAPPNLSPNALTPLLQAGINDWGGVSPVTPDHVNPEAPWPNLAALAEQTTAAGRTLIERLALVPSFARAPARWTNVAFHKAVLHRTDAAGFAREDSWHAGTQASVPSTIAQLCQAKAIPTAQSGPAVQPPGPSAIANLVRHGMRLDENSIAGLFLARESDLRAVIAAADELRTECVGDTVTFVVNRNINYTNICEYSCGFCAFAKGRSSRALRGPGYNLDMEEIARRVIEAHEHGATEVCLQGGIHPSYSGETYLRIVRTVKEAVPQMHVHAFSPLEITHGARTLNISLEEFLTELKQAGLSTLPGTAAEILDDEVRAVICPDKLTTSEWIDVMSTAHKVGLKSTATIMFGHADSAVHWARHLLRVRHLQEQTGGFTEFVPLPFVHMEAPIWRKGRARSGPTFREAVLMHAIARLALYPLFKNIQTSWVKMGLEGAALCLSAGANDLGGTLMNESITRAAGGVNGQEQDAATLSNLIEHAGRIPRQRTTLYRATLTRSAPLAAAACY
jgi:FO synthase